MKPDISHAAYSALLWALQQNDFLRSRCTGVRRDTSHLTSPPILARPWHPDNPYTANRTVGIYMSYHPTIDKLCLTDCGFVIQYEQDDVASEVCFRVSAPRMYNALEHRSRSDLRGVYLKLIPSHGLGYARDGFAIDLFILGLDGSCCNNILMEQSPKCETLIANPHAESVDAALFICFRHHRHAKSVRLSSDETTLSLTFALQAHGRSVKVRYLLYVSDLTKSMLVALVSVGFTNFNSCIQPPYDDDSMLIFII
ncbi:uncharacterized protein FOMMEDRAFT_150724 [Fomitiporia mediterranea MF3/22]|uniref:uncharacterized protein n=1 Tax=Fomitiporia mediterranea (strain MF3/22) TaxID=694068 RepID=UPI0004408B85|nr:uncharacterized protein FOMMEDRAFT_150724 [Fomitiporia mediterranea MF3/22]EJD08053.1 hypothetical protein FOMMEDRAFT_150724 [Fomitiporia mediterranea MF3/22]